MEHLPPAVASQLAQLEQRLQGCSAAVRAFTAELVGSSQLEDASTIAAGAASSLPLPRALRERGVSAAEGAQVQLHLAQALCSGATALVALFTGSEADESANGTLKRDQERLVVYDSKLRRQLNLSQAREAGAHKIDIAAANRFIDAASGQLTQEQRAALRSGGDVVAASQAKGRRVTEADLRASKRKGSGGAPAAYPLEAGKSKRQKGAKQLADELLADLDGS